MGAILSTLTTVSLHYDHSPLALPLEVNTILLIVIDIVFLIVIVIVFLIVIVIVFLTIFLIVTVIVIDCFHQRY